MKDYSGDDSREKSTDSMKHYSLFRSHILLLLLCGLLFFPFLGSSVLWDFDEGYFAAIAKEMFEKGEWIVPTFSDSELGDKPILIFWGMILSFWVFGVNEFAVRFPTALYGTATVFLTYHIARRLFASNNIALRSAFILATMLLFVVETRGTTCDGAAVCWMVAATTFYVYGCRGFRSGFVETPSISFDNRIAPWFPDRWMIVVLMNACLGMAVLAKGPAMALFGTAVIGLFLLVKAFPGRINRNPLQWIAAFLRICWKMRLLTAALAILAVAGPWFIAVGWQTNGEWLHMFFVEHNFQRTIEPTRGHTGFNLGPLFYPVMSLFGTFPWSIFFIPWLIDLCRRLRRKDELKNVYYFAVCWIVLYFGLFTLVSTKLPHYVVPAYPAIAILLGAYLVHWRRDSDLAAPFWTPVVIGALIVVGIGIMTTMYFVLPRYFPDEYMTGIVIGLIPLLAGIAGIAAYLRGGRKALDAVYVLLALLFVSTLFQWSAGQISKHAFHRSEFFQNIAPGDNGVPPLIVYVGMSDPSWVFYSGQPLRKIDIETLINCESETELREELLEIDRQRPKYLLKSTDRRLTEGRLYLVISEPDYWQIVHFGPSLKKVPVPPHFIEKMSEVNRMKRFMRQYDQLLFTRE
ncbi:MAG: glycosyltransferase family 39 protein [Planctomycetaceae bacterium]|nr:glycosyltransferase family 39 protein [Planctomycetaceae bacterium]